MAMIYIPIRSDAAPYLSAAIYQLTRPPENRDPADVSVYYCGWVQHPTRPEVASLEMPEQAEIPVHIEADSDTLKNMLQAFVPTGEITQEEVDAIAAAVVSGAGSVVDVADLIPPSWQPYVMTREQALASGWLPQPVELP